MLYDFDIRRQYETVFTGMEVVEKISDDQDYIYMVLKTPWGITDRDF